MIKTLYLGMFLSVITTAVLLTPHAFAYERHDDAYYCRQWRIGNYDVYSSQWQEINNYCNSLGV